MVRRDQVILIICLFFVQLLFLHFFCIQYAFNLLYLNKITKQSILLYSFQQQPIDYKCKNTRMGCVYNKQQLSPLIPCKTVNGILKVTIQEANIYKQSKISSMDPYLRLTMSNQEFRGYIHKKAVRSNLFNESFEFVINSCFKPQGRSLTIELSNKAMINDKVIGLGIIDIDPIISFDENAIMGSKLITISKQNQSYMEELQPNMRNMRKSQCKMKVFLNHGVEQVGYLNTMFEFIEEPVTTIGLKIIYASLRKTSTIFTTMYCSVQVIAGEQILRTHKQKDKDTKNPPTWEDETLMINIPTSLNECMIRVLDDEKQVGHLRFTFNDIIHKKGEYFFTQQLQHEQAISGVIKFCVMVGIESVVTGSKKGPRIQQTVVKTEPNQPVRTQLEPQHPVEQLGYAQMKRQLPSQKSAKMHESDFRTMEYTQPNEQQPIRQPFRQPLKLHKLQESIVVINGQQLKP